MNEFKSHFNQVVDTKIKYNEEQLEFIQSKLEDSCLLGIHGGGKTAYIIGKILVNILEKIHLLKI
jgi:hypothetical protein